MTKNFDEKHAIVVKNGSFSWQKIEDNEDIKDIPKDKNNKKKKEEKSPKENPKSGQIILQDIELKIEKNSLTAVVGSVGSGKSSLLSALLGDMEIQSGFVNMYSIINLNFNPILDLIKSIAFSAVPQ